MTEIFKSLFKRTFSSSSNQSDTSYTGFVRSEIGKPSFVPYSANEASMYRHRRQVGVNLGSIFILDKKFSPPSLRSCVVNGSWESELDFLEACMTLEQAKEALEDHWSTFVTEKDFEYLASIGINSVRIPIGYWIVDIFNNCPFKKYRYVYKTAWNWFLHMVSIAAKYKIGVLVDLHGAPGGQNTLSHCGTSSHRVQFFKNSNQEQTLKILKKLTVELAPINNVIGLSVLNEPIDNASLPNFYLSAYQTIRQASDIMLPIYISDVYNTRKYIELIKQNGMKFVVVDTHFPFDTIQQKNKRRSHKVEAKEQKLSLKKSYAQIHGNLIVGEWSAIKNKETLTSTKQGHDFSESQLEIYTETSSGHYFWNYRTSDDGDCWSFIYCHKMGILPSQYLTGLIPMTCVIEVSQLAKSRFDKYLNMACDHHNKTARHDVKDYKLGFSEGYQVGLMYLESYQSRVGFKQQLAHEYALCKSIDYEQAFIRALFTVDHLIAEFTSS